MDELVDLTQDEDEPVAAGVVVVGQREGPVDLSQLSSSSEEERNAQDKELEITSPERPVQTSAPTKALYRGGGGISQLLRIEQELRNGLLQRQASSNRFNSVGPSLNSDATGGSGRERGGGDGDGDVDAAGAAAPSRVQPAKRARPAARAKATVGATTAAGNEAATTTATATPTTTATAAITKEEAAALKKVRRQFESEKHVLKFVKVLLSPALMGGSVGLGVAQAFQQTASLAEHERISYEVSTAIASSSVSLSSQPLIRWNRLVPSEARLGEFDETAEPFAMLCFDGAALVGLIDGDTLDGSKLYGILDGIEGLGDGDGPTKIYVLAYRLEQHLIKLQQQGHREALLRGGTPALNVENIRQALSDLVICRANVELLDASSVDEASGHVVSVTKAIALRHCESQGCSSKSKFIAGKSKKQHGPGSTLNSLLVKDPLPEHTMYAVRALIAIPSVTPQISHTLVKTYGSLRGIYEFLEDRGGSTAGEAAEAKKKVLEELRTFGGQRVGPVAAENLVEFFLAEDPNVELRSGR